jgi:hypothetical protein
MGTPDKHDPRSFTQYEKVAKDGTVVAIVEFADGTIPPTDPDFTYRLIAPNGEHQ